MTVLAELESVIADVGGRAGPAVVGISRRAGRGSGVVVADGEILTLAGNLRDPGAEIGIAFAGGGIQEGGTVVGVDGVLDLALIRVPTGDIPPLDWAPEPARLGQAVVALANPGGQGLRATLGFVASIDRSYRGPRGRVVDGALEHTAPLARGSGGGPLLDAQGRLVGLNAVRVHGGLILTLPAAAVADRAALLRTPDAGGATPQLGVAVFPPGVARRLRRAVGLPDRDGVLVQAVASGSPADRAELREGDLIVSAGHAPIDDVDALYAALDRSGPGGTIDLQIVRGAVVHELAVSLGGAG